MKKISQIFSGFAVAVLSLTSLSTVAFSGVAFAAGQTCTWTGVTDNNFSTATNWTDCLGAAPTAGDVINFPFLTNTSVTLTNDLYPGVQFGGLTMDNGGSTQGQYTSYAFDATQGAIF